MEVNSLIFGTFFAFLGTFLAVKNFPKLGLLDFPERYGLLRKKLPYPGGLILWILSFGIIFMSSAFWILIFPILVLGIISFHDDRKNISPYFRLGTHIFVSFFLCLAGIKIQFITDPFTETNFEIARVFPIISLLLTMGWIIAIQNAMNWFDGAPGLSVGVAGIGLLTFGILGVVRPELFLDPNHTSLTTATLYLAGLCLGSFWFYFRQKIILGDTGSQILGFLLAVMAIFSGAKIATTLLVLSLPILDFFWVIFRRAVLEKKSPFRGDLKHLHHHLNRFFSAQTTTLILVFFSAVAGGISLFLTGYEKMIAFLCIAGLILGLNFWIWQKR